MMRIQSFALGEWVTGSGAGTNLHDAVTGEQIADASSDGLDFAAMLEHGRATGGPALRRLTFHQRARMLKALAIHLTERKEEFYRVSAYSGATRGDSWIDIDGGIGTLFAYASRGRRDFPDETYFVDGGPEALSKGGTFIGRHICVPLEGVAVQINAFNFPVWGMLEKLATSFLAGMPSIVKPATVTCYLTEVVARAIVESNILPAGSFQLICGSAGDLLDHLGSQDAVAFTGSAATGLQLRSGRHLGAHHALLIEHPAPVTRQEIRQDDEPIALREQQQQLAEDGRKLRALEQLGDGGALARRRNGRIQQHFFERRVLPEQVDERRQLGLDLLEVHLLSERHIEQGAGVAVAGGFVGHSGC